MGDAAYQPDPNGRGRKARAASRLATKLLSEAQFRKAARISLGAVETLHEISRGNVGRNGATVVKASQTLIDAAYPKQAQAHELSGSVTINLRCSFPVKGATEAKALPDATYERKSAEGRQSPITSYMLTAENGVTTTDSIDAEVMSTDDPMAAPSLIKPGSLVAAEVLTREQQRERERAEWLADKSVHPEGIALEDEHGDEP